MFEGGKGGYACDPVIDYGRRIAPCEHQSSFGQNSGGRVAGSVNSFIGQFGKFRTPAANIATLRVKLLPLIHYFLRMMR